MPDPRVQRFAPKLMRSLERAIAFCQSTLSYGRAQEAEPDRRNVLVEPVVTEVRESAGLVTDASITWVAAIERAGSPSMPIPTSCSACCSISCATRRRRWRASPSTTPPRCRSASPAAAKARSRFSKCPTPAPRAAKTREHLFQAFQTSGRPGGSGLGLAIAAELVRAHGGEIHLVEGTIGATFRITIPDRPVELQSVRNERARA